MTETVAVHDLVREAAEGRLPEWAVVTPRRREHVARVAGLMGDWAEALALPDADVVRWTAAGLLHDVVRDADPADLRPQAPPHACDAPDALLHGPVGAERLRIQGVEDGELLQAVAYHTLGHHALGRMGLALYAADFLEPGRDLRNEWRAGLRARMPSDLVDVVREIAAARIIHLIETGSSLREETLAFWNRLARGSRPADPPGGT